MKDREKIQKVTHDLIENTDIKYLAHYRFENLEGMVFEIIRDWIWDCTVAEAEDIVENVYEYVLKELESEKMKFLRYGLPQYFSLVTKQSWHQMKNL